MVETSEVLDGIGGKDSGMDEHMIGVEESVASGDEDR